MTVVVFILLWTLVSVLMAYVWALDGVVRPKWWQNIVLIPAFCLTALWLLVEDIKEGRLNEGF